MAQRAERHKNEYVTYTKLNQTKWKPRFRWFHNRIDPHTVFAAASDAIAKTTQQYVQPPQSQTVCWKPLISIIHTHIIATSQTFIIYITYLSPADRRVKILQVTHRACLVRGRTRWKRNHAACRCVYLSPNAPWHTQQTVSNKNESQAIHLFARTLVTFSWNDLIILSAISHQLTASKTTHHF